MNDGSNRPAWLVTGAAGALGSELVRQLTASGRDCIALDKDARGLDRLHDAMLEEGLTAPALMPLDLVGAGPEDYERLCASIEEQLGRLDALVHNAAAFVALRPLLHQPVDEWFRIMQAGLTGPFLLTRALMPLLSASIEGRIVFVNDGQCLEKPANWAAYGVVQAGRQQMVRMLKAEAGRHADRIQEIDPGPFFSRLRTAAWPSDSPDRLPTAAQAASDLIGRLTASPGQQPGPF